MKVLAIYGSPRDEGNTSQLLKKAVQGAREAGALVEEIALKNLKMSPCLEIYACRETGRCAIKDDFQEVYDTILTCQGIILASPIFFYTVSAHTKILMDRCQSLWVKKYLLKKTSSEHNAGKGLFISVGATKGKKLFDGTLLTMRYFFDALNMELWRTLLYRDLDSKGDVLKHQQYLEEACQAGRDVVNAIERDL